MDAGKVGMAAEILADLRVRAEAMAAPLDELPPDCRPATIDAAYAVQDATRALLAARGLGRQAGWKIGATAKPTQDFLGIDHPAAGTLYEATLHTGHADLDRSVYLRLGVECEIAVRLGAGLPARPGGHDRDSVAPAIATAMASMELIEHRFAAGAGTPSLIADDVFSAGCVIGDEHPFDEVAEGLDDLDGRIVVDGDTVATAPATAILGHPLNALAWLADHRAARGTPLQAGDLVSLGSVVSPWYPDRPCRIAVSFDRLGSVSVTVT